MMTSVSRNIWDDPEEDMVRTDNTSISHSHRPRFSHDSLYATNIASVQPKAHDVSLDPTRTASVSSSSTADKKMKPYAYPTGMNSEVGSSSEQSGDSSVPEGGARAYSVVLGSFLCTTAIFGLNNSVGVLQTHWQAHQLRAFAPRDVAWIPGLYVFMSLVLGIYVGPLFDQHGPRRLLALGSVVYITGILGMVFLPDYASDAVPDGMDHDPSSSRVNSAGMYAALVFLWGIIMGSGAAICGTVEIGVLAHWFDRRRGAMTGIVFVGSSVGGVLFPLALTPILEYENRWRTGMLVLLGTESLLLLTGNLLIRGRLPGRHRAGGLLNLGLFRDSRFLWTVVAIARQSQSSLC
jgi:MFS family permease